MSKQPQIDERLRFKDFVVVKAHLDAKSREPKTNEEEKPPNLKLRVQSAFPQDAPKTLLVKFIISLSAEKFKLELEAIAEFVSNKEYSEEFKNSPFVKINAPAIAFPFVRSYINTLVSSSGFGTFFLPAINFAKLAQM